MPRLKAGKVVPEADAVGTVGALASALGVHRNTVGVWRTAGAPAGPPFSVRAWRAWARERDFKVAVEAGAVDTMRRLTGMDEPLGEPLVPLKGKGKGKGKGRAAAEDDGGLARAIAELPGSNPYDQVVARKIINYKGALEREKVRGETIENERRQVELKKASKDLVTRRDALGAADRVRKAFTAQLEQLRSLVGKHLGEVGIDWKERVGIAVEKATAELLTRVGQEESDE